MAVPTPCNKPVRTRSARGMAGKNKNIYTHTHIYIHIHVYVKSPLTALSKLGASGGASGTLEHQLPVECVDDSTLIPSRVLVFRSASAAPCPHPPLRHRPLTPLISHHPSYTTHLNTTPSYTAHLTPPTLHHSFYTTHLTI